MTSGEIGTGFNPDSQYIEILCIYSQYLNILFFALPGNGVFVKFSFCV